MLFYDREADVFSLYLRRASEEEFVEIAPNIIAELDKKGSIIGVEIFDASKFFRSLMKANARQHQGAIRAVSA